MGSLNVSYGGHHGSGIYRMSVYSQGAGRCLNTNIGRQSSDVICYEEKEGGTQITRDYLTGINATTTGGLKVDETVIPGDPVSSDVTNAICAAHSYASNDIFAEAALENDGPNVMLTLSCTAKRISEIERKDGVNIYDCENGGPNAMWTLSSTAKQISEIAKKYGVNIYHCTHMKTAFGLYGTEPQH